MRPLQRRRDGRRAERRSGRPSPQWVAAAHLKAHAEELRQPAAIRQLLFGAARLRLVLGDALQIE